MSRTARFLLPVLAITLAAAAATPRIRAANSGAIETDDATNATRLLAAVRGVSEPVCQLVTQAVRNNEYGGSSLLMVLQGDEVPTDSTARWALSSMRSVGAVQVLSAGLRDADPCVRAVAGRILAKTHLAPAYDALKTALADNDSVVRAAAARTLGRQHDRNAPGQLIAAMHDPSASVRAAAADALGNYGRRRNFVDGDFNFNFDFNYEAMVMPVMPS
ncbi:MAG TPA: HEAT repeat domain-containing protein, partial [Gemmatimonadales bacterium]